MSAIKVGTKCMVERHNRGRIDHSWSAKVERITPKRAYFGNGHWFALDDPKHEVKPRYLDYRTFVVSLEEPAPVVPEG